MREAKSAQPFRASTHGEEMVAGSDEGGIFLQPLAKTGRVGEQERGVTRRMSRPLTPLWRTARSSRVEGRCSTGLERSEGAGSARCGRSSTMKGGDDRKSDLMETKS